jgi:hypothetical protein
MVRDHLHKAIKCGDFEERFPTSQRYEIVKLKQDQWQSKEMVREDTNQGNEWVFTKVQVGGSAS